MAASNNANADITSANKTAEQDLKKVLPADSSLAKITQIESTEKRNAAIDSLVSSHKDSVKSSVKSVVQDHVSSVVDSRLAEIGTMLRKNGINLSEADLARIGKEFTNTFMNSKVYGKSANQRIATLASKSADDMTDAVKKARKRGDPAPINRYLEKTSGGTTQGFSLIRSGRVLAQSEVARANQDVVKYVADAVSAEYLKWNTRNDSKVCPVCKEKARAVTVSAAELPGEDRHGVYRTSEMPSYSHGNCRCWFTIVTGKSLEVSKLIQGNKKRALDLQKGTVSESEQALAIMRQYTKNRVAVDMGVSPERLAERTAVYKQAVKEQSLKPIANFDRLFVANARKGQIRAINDLARIAGIQISPELIDALGPENAVRVLMNKYPKKFTADAINAFESQVKKVAKKSQSNIDSMMQDAANAKYILENATKHSEKAGMRVLHARSVKAARIEAGQSYGYSDIQGRVLTQMQGKADKLVLNFSTPDELAQYLDKFPNTKYTVFKSSNTIVVPPEAMNKYVQSVDIYTKEQKRILAMKEGKFNKGNYTPKGCNPTVIKQGKKIDFKLSDSQESVLRFAKETKTAILNMAPGTGKTVLASSISGELAAEAKIAKVLYVCPSDLTKQAADEFGQFVKGKKIGLGGSSKDRAKMYKDDSFVHIISHDNLNADIKNGLIKPGDYDAVFVDEFHLLGSEGKNAVKRMKSEYRYLLSGTPINRSPEELFSVLDWIDPKLFKDMEEYKKLFADASASTPFFQESVYRAINDKLGTKMITRKSELKPYVRKAVAAQLDQSALQLEKLEKQYDKARGVDKAAVRLKMQKFLDGPLPEKVKALETIQKAHAGEKKIIFVQDASQADEIRKTLIDQGVNPTTIFKYDTSVAVKDRDSVKWAFKSTKEAEYLIMDGNSAVGVDIPEAKVVVHWTVPPNQSSWDQRTARAWRKGNTGTTVYDMITKYKNGMNTLEDRKRFEQLRLSDKVLTAYKNAEEVDTTGFISIMNNKEYWDE